MTRGAFLPVIRMHVSVEQVEAAVGDHETALRRIIEIVQATPHTSQVGGGRRGDTPSRLRIAQALTSYRGAIAELVLAGSLDVDQGRELDEMVGRIEREEMKTE